MIILYLHREDEKNMNKTTKVIMAALLMCMVLISVGSVMAKNDDPKGDQEQIQDQLKDGTCNDVEADQQLDIGDKTRDRLRDGSCLDPSCEPDADKPYKDGSCKL